VTCYSPIKAYTPLSKLDGGKLVFNSRYALNSDHPISIPCGYCVGCRIARSRDWAVRCMHESQMHQQNSFITLTYDDDHLPDDYSVNVRTWQLFMYRLRKSLGSQKIRFFACGEYGEKTLRPHYHALIFGHQFPDLKFYKRAKSKHAIYTSESLSKIWTYGQSWVGTVSYQSSAYVARYIMKKITGDRSTEHYTRIHPLTLKAVTVEPEFCVQSRRPGIGSTWFDKYKSDAFPSDFIIVDGKKHPVPSYYAKKLEEAEHEKIKRQRKKNSLPRRADNTPARLKVREEVKRSQINQLKREL